MDIQIVGLAAGMLIYKIAEIAIKRTNGSKSVLTDEQHHWIKELHDMHDVKDESGRPIWYMPNQVGKQQEKIIELLGDMAMTQKETTIVLERIIDRLDRR